jgi:hypothetical protein
VNIATPPYHKPGVADSKQDWLTRGDESVIAAVCETPQMSSVELDGQVTGERKGVSETETQAERQGRTNLAGWPSEQWLPGWWAPE